MNSQTTLAQEASPCAELRGRKALWLGVIVGAALLGAVLVLRWNTPKDRSLKWLTPAEVVRANRAGLITQLKWKLFQFIGPLGNRSKARLRFLRPRPRISLPGKSRTRTRTRRRRRRIGRT